MLKQKLIWQLNPSNVSSIYKTPLCKREPFQGSSMYLLWLLLSLKPRALTWTKAAIVAGQKNLCYSLMDSTRLGVCESLAFAKMNISTGGTFCAFSQHLVIYPSYLCWGRHEDQRRCFSCGTPSAVRQAPGHLSWHAQRVRWVDGKSHTPGRINPSLHFSSYHGFALASSSWVGDKVKQHEQIRPEIWV